MAHLRIVLDVSGSMSRPKLELAISIVRSVLDAYPRDATVDLLAFNASLVWATPQTMRASKETRNRIERFLATAKGWGGTDLLGGLSEAVQRSAPWQSAILCLTDGVATCGETRSARILQGIVAANRRDVPIICCAIGPHCDTGLLRRLADTTKARAFEFPGNATRSSSLQAVSAAVKNSAGSTAEAAIGGHPAAQPYLYVLGLGACREIGRSCFLVRSQAFSVLLDCGLGVEEPIPPVEDFIDPAQIDVLVLTHAHLDHIGYVPQLYARGFRGHLLCSAATREFAMVAWSDPNLAQNYSPADVAGVLNLWRRVEAGTEVRDGGLKLQFFRAGHILGALTVSVEYAGKRIVYSGDLGPATRTVDSIDVPPAGSDVLLIESTYGNRAKRDPDAEVRALIEKCEETLERGGVALIPAFAIGRSQEVLAVLSEAQAAGRLAGARVLVDGQIRKMNPVYIRHRPNMRFLSSVTYVKSRDALIKELLLPRHQPKDAMGPPTIIVTTAGMCVGPAQSYLEALAPDPRSTVILVSYQAKGTPGYAIAEGTFTPRCKTTGRAIPFEMEVARYSLSAHIDAAEQDDYITKASPRHVLLIHGGGEALNASSHRCVERGVAVSIAEPRTPHVLFGKPVVQRRQPRPAAASLYFRLRRDWGAVGLTAGRRAAPRAPTVTPRRIPALGRSHIAHRIRQPTLPAAIRPIRSHISFGTCGYARMRPVRPRHQRHDGWIMNWRGQVQGSIRNGQVYDNFGRSHGYMRGRQMVNWRGRSHGYVQRARISGPRVGTVHRWGSTRPTGYVTRQRTNWYG